MQPIVREARRIAAQMRDQSDDPKRYSNNAIATRLIQGAAALESVCDELSAVQMKLDVITDEYNRAVREPLRRIAWARFVSRLRRDWW